MSSTEIYKKNSWTFAASLPQARNHVFSAALDNSVFVFGKNIISTLFILFSLIRRDRLYYTL